MKAIRIKANSGWTYSLFVFNKRVFTGTLQECKLEAHKEHEKSSSKAALEAGTSRQRSKSAA